MTMWNSSKEKTNGLILIKKMKENKYVTYKQMTTTELQAPDLGQSYGGNKLV